MKKHHILLAVFSIGLILASALTLGLIFFLSEVFYESHDFISIMKTAGIYSLGSLLIIPFIPYTTVWILKACDKLINKIQ